MIKSLIYSITFHSVLVLITILSLPFMLREPIDLPPIVSMELIQISDTTSLPYAPKVRKIIEETKKKEEERLVSEQAPPTAKAKEKPDRIPLPNKKEIPVDLKGSAGNTNNISISIATDGSTRQEEGSGDNQSRRLGRVISVAVQDELQRQKRPGGILSPYGAA